MIASADAFRRKPTLLCGGIIISASYIDDSRPYFDINVRMFSVTLICFRSSH